MNIKFTSNWNGPGKTFEGSVYEGEFQYLPFRIVSKRHSEKAGNPKFRNYKGMSCSMKHFSI